MCMAMVARPQNRPPLEIADIFRLHGEVYRQNHMWTPEQLQVMHAIETCRTPALGGHLEACDRCDYSRPSYNSCSNRHCPKCQSLRQAMWVEQRKERLLPVPYFHVVFTLPAELRAVARRNQREIYKLLFEAASSTLLTLGEDPERLGARLALTCVLHTWTRELDFHPHVHCIVSGGGLSLDGTQWNRARTKYLFPVQVMSALYRGLFLDGLKKKVARGQVRLDAQQLQALLDKLYQTDWVVYAKAPFGGPEQVFQYLGRYTHRVGISNQRLISMGPEGVCFATKGGRTVTLTAQEFIRRFLLHVLPHGFVKLRHYGLWASGRAAEKLERARELLAAGNPSGSPLAQMPAPTATALGQDLAQTAETAETEEQEERTLQQRLLRLCGIDWTRCPKCQTGRMVKKPLAAAELATGPSSQAGANTS